jgi:hypothetical protein
MAREKVYKWQEVKGRYVLGYTEEDGKHLWPTIGQIAMHYEMPKSQVEEVAKRENWVEVRNEYRSLCYEKVFSQTAEERSKAITEFDMRCYMIAKQAVEWAYHAILTSDEEDKAVLIPKLAKVVTEYQRLGHVALSMDGNVQSVNVDMLKKEMSIKVEEMTLEQLRRELQFLQIEG